MVTGNVQLTAFLSHQFVTISKSTACTELHNKSLLTVTAYSLRGCRGKRESGKENPYSCVVLAGARSMEERRSALQVTARMSAGHALRLRMHVELD